MDGFKLWRPKSGQKLIGSGLYGTTLRFVFDLDSQTTRTRIEFPARFTTFGGFQGLQSINPPDPEVQRLLAFQEHDYPAVVRALEPFAAELDAVTTGKLAYARKKVTG